MTPAFTAFGRRALLATMPVAMLLSTASTSYAQGDPKVVDRIINEGKNNSRVWLYLEYLAGEIGPRLTGSSRLERANNWAKDQFEQFGMSNARLHEWGTIPVRFDRGPSYAKITAPVARDLQFTTRSWAAGTDGPVKGKVVKAPTTMEELEAMKDDLKGAWVLSKPITRGGRRGVTGDAAGGTPTDPRAPNARSGTENAEGAPPAAPAGQRPGGRRGAGGEGAGGGAAGAGEGNAAQPPAGGDRPANRDRGEGAGGAGGGGAGGNAARNAQSQAEELWAAMKAAGVVGRIVSSTSDIVTTGGSFSNVDYDKLPTDVSVTITRADYDAINSRLGDGESVEVEIDLNHTFTNGPIPVYNTIAEIPGTEFPEQVVIVSAHLDSWDGPGSQGAQDNGTGSSVTIEAARILMASGVKPRRTIRFCLWSGEEQGLLGSKGYLESLSDEEKANISAVFVDDGGTNYQGGLVCVEEMKDMLTKATAPVNAAFPDLKVDILVQNAMPRGGGSDHSTFNRAGIPGFFWEEDGIGGREGKNYRYVWHTQHDTPRYAVPEYLVQSATCSAVTAYNLAMADEMLPRYTPPAPSAAQEDTGPFTPKAGPLTGTWIGTTIRDGQPSEFTSTFTIEHSTEGKMRGKMYSRFGEVALSAIAYDEKTKALTFKVESEMGSTAYAMKLNAEDELTGTSTREGRDPSEFNSKRDTKEIKPPVAPEGEGAGGAGGAGGGQRPRGGAGGTGGGE